MTDDRSLLPCSECGIDLFHRDCQETTIVVNAGTGRTFQGEPLGHEVPAYICPECGAETMI